MTCEARLFALGHHSRPCSGHKVKRPGWADAVRHQVSNHPGEHDGRWVGSVEVRGEAFGEVLRVPLGRIGPWLRPAVAGGCTDVTDEDVLMEVGHAEAGDHRVHVLDLEL